MKAYLQKFRSGAFTGVLALFKRTFMPAIALTFIVTIVMFAVTALVFTAMGISFLQMFTSDPVGIRTYTPPGFGTMMGSILLSALLFFFIGSWVYYTFLKLNDNEIRKNNNSPLSALAGSFSSRIFTIMGFVFLMSLLSAGTLTMFSLIGVLFTLIPVIGILIMFIGYFIICIFLLRYILGLPAIVHGSMGIMDAFTFSRTHITWKRSFKIFLIVFICYVVLMGMMILILYAINGSVSESISSDDIMPAASSMTVSAIIGIVVYAAMLSFGFSALSALYFRYSDEQRDEAADVQDHLVGEF